MKKLLTLGVIVLLISGCAGRSLRRGDLTLKEYGKVVVVDINEEPIWSAHPARREDPRWTASIDKGSQIIEEQVRYKLLRWKGDTEKELKVFIDLVKFNPGSRGKRLAGAFLGGLVGGIVSSSGTADVKYKIRLIDAESAALIAEFEAKGSITDAGYSGAMTPAFEACSKYIVKFIYDNRQ